MQYLSKGTPFDEYDVSLPSLKDPPNFIYFSPGQLLVHPFTSFNHKVVILWTNFSHKVFSGFLNFIQFYFFKVKLWKYLHQVSLWYILVLIFCVEFLELSHLTRDLSQPETKYLLLQAEQLTTLTILSEIYCHFVYLLR